VNLIRESKYLQRDFLDIGNDSCKPTVSLLQEMTNMYSYFRLFFFSDFFAIALNLIFSFMLVLLGSKLWFLNFIVFALILWKLPNKLQHRKIARQNLEKMLEIARILFECETKEKKS